MSERIDRGQLARDIESAFSGLGDPPAPRDLTDDSVYGDEIVSFFGGEPWHEIDRTGLGEWYWAPGSFTVEGFAYYLPSFLLAILEHYRGDEQLASDLLSLFAVRDPNEPARSASAILSAELRGNVLTADLEEYLRNVAKTPGAVDWLQRQEAWRQKRLAALTVPQLHVVLDLISWLRQEHGKDFEESEFDNPAAALRAELRRRESGP